MVITLEDHEIHPISIDIFKSDSSYVGGNFGDKVDNKLTVFQIYNVDEYVDHLIMNKEQMLKFHQQLTKYLEAEL
jgi:hypothetical protein